MQRPHGARLRDLTVDPLFGCAQVQWLVKPATTVSLSDGLRSTGSEIWKLVDASLPAQRRPPSVIFFLGAREGSVWAVCAEGFPDFSMDRARSQDCSVLHTVPET